MNFVLYKLPKSILVHVDTARLTVVDLTFHHRGIGACLHLKARYPIIMDVVFLEITL